MKAMLLERFGAPDTLVEREVDRPSVAPGRVIVRVAAAGVNPVDVKTRAGAVGDWFGAPPIILGWDVSGVVDEVGNGVAGLALGDEVFGLARFPELAGTYAEYVSVPAHELLPRPVELGHPEAGALPLAGLTALQALDHAGVTAGQRVLVHAAAGGVGHLLVQLAKARGAYVIGTARAANHAFLRELGADEPIDYAGVTFEEAVAGVDVVFDFIGGEYGPRSLRVLRPGGTLVVLLGGVDPELAEAARRADVRVLNHLVHPDRHGLAGLVEHVRRGELRVELAGTLPLARAAEAHERSETGRTRGKLVLTVA